MLIILLKYCNIASYVVVARMRVSTHFSVREERPIRSKLSRASSGQSSSGNRELPNNLIDRGSQYGNLVELFRRFFFKSVYKYYDEYRVFEV